MLIYFILGVVLYLWLDDISLRVRVSRLEDKIKRMNNQ